MAAIEKFRPNWWKQLTNAGIWLWLPGLAAVLYGLYLGKDDPTTVTCIWQFPVIAFGMAALVICAVSP